MIEHRLFDRRLVSLVALLIQESWKRQPLSLSLSPFICRSPFISRSPPDNTLNTIAANQCPV